MLVGSAALALSWPIALAISVVLIIVAISYYQTVHAYPTGGGAYTVAKENSGTWPGLVAGAALLTDYVLTVAVSISAGVAAIRNPALLAKMAATLPFMSGGRFILGLGAGWHEEEYLAYGYEFPSAPVRVEQLEEAIQIIRRMWGEETTSFEGQYYRVVEARCEPRRDPIPPIMFGAFKPKMLRLAAKYADWWNVSSTSPARYRPMVDAFEYYCAELGRDPSLIRRTWIGGCACAPTQEEAAVLTEGRWSADDDEDFGFVGIPDQSLAQMWPFVDLGIDYFMFDCAGFPRPTTLQMLVSEVLPRLADLKAQ